MAIMREIFGDHCLGVGVFYGPHVYVSNALDHFTSRSMGHQVMAR